MVPAPAPLRHSAATGRKVEALAMATAAWFYRKAKVLFAPNQNYARCLRARRAGPVF